MPHFARRRPALALALAVLAPVCAAAGGCATTTHETRLKHDAYDAKKKLTRELIVRGDWANAFAYADDLHRERPDDPEVLVLRGTVFRERGLPAEGEADLREALRLDEDEAEAHAALAVLYDTTLRGSQAEPEHRRAVKLQPKNVGYLNNFGFSLFLRGKNQEAIGFYQQAARLDPTSQRVRTNLGFAYAASGDLRRAAREFEIAGTPAEAKNNLGFAYERRGDFSHAYELYLEAARMDARFAKARANLVHAAQALGREVPSEAVLAPPPEPQPQSQADTAPAGPSVSPGAPFPMLSPKSPPQSQTQPTPSTPSLQPMQSLDEEKRP